MSGTASFRSFLQEEEDMEGAHTLVRDSSGDSPEEVVGSNFSLVSDDEEASDSLLQNAQCFVTMF